MNTSLAWRRIAAFLIDWCLIALWGGLLFGAVTWWSGGSPPAPTGSWNGQLVGLLTMTLPVVGYFSLTESSRGQGSLGKRATGLVVARGDGRRLHLSSALLRNLVKFAPWEFGHMLAQQAAFSGESGLPAWTVIPAVIAFAGPVVWLVELFRTGRTPYDRVSAAYVRMVRA